MLQTRSENCTWKKIGGGSWIRTNVARSAADLQSATINHSAIPPRSGSGEKDSP